MYINIANHKKLRLYQEFLKQNLSHLSYAFTDWQSLKNKSFEINEHTFQTDIYDKQPGDIQDIDDYADRLDLNPNTIRNARCFRSHEYSKFPNKYFKLGSPFMFHNCIYRDNGNDMLSRRNYICIDNRILNPVGIYVFTLLIDDDFIEHQLEKYWYALQDPTGLALNRMLNYHVNSLTILVTEKNLEALINHKSTTLQIEKLIINKAYVDDLDERCKSSIVDISKFNNTTSNYDRSNTYGIIQCHERTLNRIAATYRKFNPNIITTIFLPYHEKVITYHVYYNQQYDIEKYRLSSDTFDNWPKTMQNPSAAYIIEKFDNSENNYLEQIEDFMNTINNQLARYLYRHCKITINEKQQLALSTDNDNHFVNKFIHKINQRPDLLLDKLDIPNILVKNNLIKSYDRSVTSRPVDLDSVFLAEFNSLNNIINVMTNKYFYSQCKIVKGISFTLDQKVRNLLFTRSADFVERLPVEPVKTVTGQKPADNDYWMPLIKNQDTLFTFIASLHNADQPTLYKTKNNMYITDRNGSVRYTKLLKYPK